jgi:hypothetical protein
MKAKTTAKNKELLELGKENNDENAEIVKFLETKFIYATNNNFFMLFTFIKDFLEWRKKNG